MNIEQLSFDFNKPQHDGLNPRRRTSWRIHAIARRHNLPLTQASIVADELRFPIGGVR